MYIEAFSECALLYIIRNKIFTNNPIRKFQNCPLYSLLKKKSFFFVVCFFQNFARFWKI